MQGSNGQPHLGADQRRNRAEAARVFEGMLEMHASERQAVAADERRARPEVGDPLWIGPAFERLGGECHGIIDGRRDVRAQLDGVGPPVRDPRQRQRNPVRAVRVDLQGGFEVLDLGRVAQTALRDGERGEQPGPIVLDGLADRPPQ